MAGHHLFRQAALALPLCVLGFLPAGAAEIALPYKAPPGLTQDIQWGNLWTGVGATPDYVGGYLGFVFSPQRNLWSNGIVFRGDINGGVYTYNGAIPFNGIQVNTYGADAMVGYRMALDPRMTRWLTGYIGVNVETHDQPDPAAQLRGSQVGVKGLLEFNGPIADRLNLYALATYSTAFSTYYSTARLQFRVARNVELGPEAIALGDVVFDQVRAGAAVGFDTGFGAIILSGGYLWGTRNTGGGVGSRDGLYGNVQFTFVLR